MCKRPKNRASALGEKRMPVARLVWIDASWKMLFVERVGDEEVFFCCLFLLLRYPLSSIAHIAAALATICAKRTEG